MNFSFETIYFILISAILSTLYIISAYKDTEPSSAGAVRRDDITTGVAFLILVPLVAHFLFSWRGFNPTDDGFILAYSRRILEGQVPHRDFITIRPAGSAYLHAPFVLFGGDYTFWISRAFVWFQFAYIAWAWTCIINKMTEAHLKPIEKVIFALIAFAFSSHNFPPMAWHTIDGLFLFSIGLILCLRNSQLDKLAGYFLIGMAYLCKQNFLPLVFAVVLLGDWRRIRYWLAMALPGVIYVVYLLSAGAMPDAIIQLGSQSNILAVGVVPYVLFWVVPCGVLLGYLSMKLIFGQRKRVIQFTIGLILIYGTLLGLSFGLDHPLELPFMLFGVTAGATLFFIIKRMALYGWIGTLALLTAWSISVSVGFNTPALAGGILAVLLMCYCRIAQRHSIVPVFFVVLLLTSTLVNYEWIRNKDVYRDRPVPDLTYSLDDVMQGGKFIKTNKNTFLFMTDLKTAIAKTGGRSYAILPVLAAHWVNADHANPLPIDWAQQVELNKPSLIDRVTSELEAKKGNIVVIVQKIMAEKLSDGFVVLPNVEYWSTSAVVPYVKTHFTKVGETNFFDLYK